MRIFIALDIPDEIRSRIAEYMERARQHAPEARWARVEGLHVTLKFVGEVNESRLQEIKSALSAIKAASFDVAFENAGFFPTSRSPRVFWIGVQAGGALPQLAAHIDQSLRMGVTREEREYNPHLTLARGGAPGSLKGLVPLLELEGPPRFGTMAVREFFLFQSLLGKGGAKYTKLEKFVLDDPVQ
ncbi:MAG: RNA 2',3'-cyclic phosphodiesterase [Candidatus Angelobacter sp.]